MNLLALAGSSYENAARGILYVIYEIIWKCVYTVLLLIDEVTKLFYRVAGVNVSDGVVQNKNMLDQMLNQNIVGAWYGIFILIATVLVIVFSVIAIIRNMGSGEERKSVGPILKNVGLALLLLIALGPIVLFLISALTNVALLIAGIGGNNNISISDIIFSNSGNLITVYNETFSTEFTSFRDLGGDFLYDFLYNPSAKEGATPLTFYWYIALLGGGFVLYNLGCIVVEIVKRIFNIVLLYIGSPFAISKLALDDGKSFKEWQTKFIYEFLLLLAQIGTFMVFMALVNVLNNIDFEGMVDTSTGLEDPNMGLLEPIPEENPSETEEVVAFSLLNGLGRMLVIMAAVSVTRSSATMFADLLTAKDTKTETALESMLSKISSRAGTKTRTITKTTTTTTRDTVFVEQKGSPGFVSVAESSNRKDDKTSHSGANTINNHITQNVNVNNKFTNNNKITNRESRDGITKGKYAQTNMNPSNIYINTTKGTSYSDTKPNKWKLMDDSNNKVMTTVIKDYTKASNNLSQAIQSGDSGKMRQTLKEYTSAYVKEAEAVNNNYRKFEVRANSTLKSDVNEQTRQELRTISTAYKKAQMDYSKTASKLKEFDGERMSTQEALKIKEQADKQRETLMNASNKAAQFYEKQKKGE